MNIQYLFFFFFSVWKRNKTRFDDKLQTRKKKVIMIINLLHLLQKSIGCHIDQCPTFISPKYTSEKSRSCIQRWNWNHQWTTSDESSGNCFHCFSRRLVAIFDLEYSLGCLSIVRNSSIIVKYDLLVRIYFFEFKSRKSSNIHSFFSRKDVRSFVFRRLSIRHLTSDFVVLSCRS